MMMIKKSIFAIFSTLVVSGCYVPAVFAQDAPDITTCTIDNPSIQTDISDEVFIKVFGKRLIVPSGFMFVQNSENLIYLIRHGRQFDEKGDIYVGSFNTDQSLDETLKYLDERGAKLCKLEGLDLYVSKEKESEGMVSTYTVRIFNSEEYVTVLSTSETFWMDVAKNFIPLNDRDLP